jgi:uncharacterized membrane protein (DUF4010 family)
MEAWLPAWLTGLLPIEGLKIILVLFLSFLVGFEREEHRAESKGAVRYAFGGVRTFPLIGLIGYVLTLLSGASLTLPAVGFAVIGAFLWLSYQHKLATSEIAGATTEVSGLAIYLVGALVSRGEFWIATTIAVTCVLLLELKAALENLSRRLPGEEILAFAKFLLLTAVILPIVPNRIFGSFGFNPFKAWLVVVAASGISYGSYLLQKTTRGSAGILASAVLGGAYSSTVTTVVLAKRSREAHSPHLFAGGMLMSSGVMYARLLVLIAFFNRELAARLLVPFLVAAIAGVAFGWFWARVRAAGDKRALDKFDIKNPLELSAAFLFALMFVALLAAVHYVAARFGRGGIYGLAAITGTVDVDPFVLGLTQSGQPIALAAHAIAIAAASNNIMKGIYAFSFGDRKTGVQGLILLVGLALVGLAALFF